MPITTLNDLLFTNTNSQKENSEYLESQLITYIGNKRSLLNYIGKAVNYVQENLVQEKLRFFDAFSGSGVVSRYFRSYAKELYVNDLEEYAQIINSCYLSNEENRDMIQLRGYYCQIKENLEDIQLEQSWKKGIISNLYAPKDDKNIKPTERVFYTTRNAAFIDTARDLIGKMPSEIQAYFLAPLLSEASIHVNTSGVFKGFYKDTETGIGKFGGKNEDALSRITGNISLPFPVFSEYNCPTQILQGDINKIVDDVPFVDIAYLDPPYNQHPYGSNYFMLNIIAKNKKPKHISKVSGIPTDWNRSVYNKKKDALNAFSELVSKIKAHFVIISFNSEGFIPLEDMTKLLKKFGKFKIMESEYNTFRASRNLSDRNKHVTEYIYLLEKK